MTITFNPLKLATLIAELGDVKRIAEERYQLELLKCAFADAKARVASVNSPLAGQVFGGNRS